MKECAALPAPPICSPAPRMIIPPPFYHAGGFSGLLKGERGVRKFFKKYIDKCRKPAIIANVVARQSNMDAEMAELVEGARLEIV